MAEEASRNCLKITRDVFTQESLDQRYSPRYVDFSMGSRMRQDFRRMCGDKRQMVTKWAMHAFPPSQWIRDYKWRTYLIKDVISGLTVGVMNIPQGMAYGMLAGLPPVYGLYTSFYLPLIYAFLGTSLHMSVGVFAVISLMVSTAVDKAAPLIPPLSGWNDTFDEANASSIISWFCGEAGKGFTRDTEAAVNAAVTLTFCVGVCQILFGFLHMGFISVYLSDQLVEGLTAGSAILVFTSQVGQVFGISDLPQANGVLGILKFYVCFFSKIALTNWATLVTSVICISFLVVVKEVIDPPFRRKYKLPIPSELFVLVFATLASHYGNFNGFYSIKTVGLVPTGLKAPRLPKADLIPTLLPNTITISIVVFSIGISLGKLFGKKHDYEVKANQEWFALGITHFISSFFWCHCGGSSLSRSVLQEEQGSKSQIASIVGAFVILAVLLSLGPVFQNLPRCALAAIIIVNLKGMFLQFRKLPPLWRRSKPDFAIWLVSLTSVVLCDISYGLAISVVYALLTVVFRSQWPDSICLGRLPNTELYKGLNAYKDAIEIPGIKIYRFESTLYFANSDTFRKELNRHTGVDVVREKYLRKRKVARKKSNRIAPPDEINMADVAREEGLRSIIVDCSPFPYVDMTGLEALRQVYEDYAFLGIQVAFACVKVAVRQMMEASDFFKRVPKSALFPSVHDAVLFLSPSTNQGGGGGERPYDPSSHTNEAYVFHTETSGSATTEDVRL